MRIRQNNGTALTEGVIWKKLLVYFFPILLGTFFQQLYNTVDAWVVGNRLGDAALAAVGGTTNVLINLLVNFFIGLSTGATVLISQCYGMEDEDGVQRSVHTAIALSIAAGALLMVIGISLARWALERMGTTPEVIGDAAPICVSILRALYSTFSTTSVRASCAPSAIPAVRWRI